MSVFYLCLCLPPLSKSVLCRCCALGTEIAHKKPQTSIGHSLVISYSQYEIMLLLLFFNTFSGFQFFCYFASISMFALSVTSLESILDPFILYLLLFPPYIS